MLAKLAVGAGGLQLPNMGKEAISLLILNCFATRFQVSSNPLSIAWSLRQGFGWGDNRCCTSHSANDLSRPEDRKDGLLGKGLTDNPRGISSLKEIRVEKGFTTFQFPGSGTAGEMESKPIPVNITLKQLCVIPRSHTGPQNDNSHSTETKEHPVGWKTLQAMEE